MYNQLFCDHDYLIEKEYIVPSELDMYKEYKIIPMKKVSTIRQYILIYKCCKCKKLKTIINIESQEH